LPERLISARARLRGAAQIDQHVAEILDRYQVARYLKVTRVVREQDTFKQDRRGRPGPDMVYRKITRRRYDIEWTLDSAAVDYDQKSDGMYPSCRARHDGYYAASRIMPRCLPARQATADFRPLPE
jgi:hypothetical protein